MIKDIEKCESCKMCDTIISLHERIKLLESAAVEIYGRLLPQAHNSAILQGLKPHAETGTSA
jgi:hypothetical protein